MKTIIITIIGLALLNSLCEAQSKPKLQQVWENVGSGWIGNKPDTTTETYALKGKDSVSVSVETDNCRCQFWRDYEGKKHSSSGIIRRSLSANFWRWQKDITIVGKDTIKRSKPYWATMLGMGFNYQGIYTQDGKFIQPEYIIDKYGTHKIN